jgi:hypothetical protein
VGMTLTYLAPLLVTVSPIFERYLCYNYDEIQHIQFMAVVIPFVILVISWVLQVDRENERLYMFYQNSMAIGLLLGLFSAVNVLFFRVGLLFMMNSIIFLPMIIANSKSSIFIKLIVMAFSVIYCFYNLTNNNGSVVPYNTFF